MKHRDFKDNQEIFYFASLGSFLDTRYLDPQKQRYLRFQAISSLFSRNLSTVQVHEAGKLHFKKWRTGHFSGDICFKAVVSMGP